MNEEKNEDYSFDFASKLKEPSDNKVQIKPRDDLTKKEKTTITVVFIALIIVLILVTIWPFIIW